MLLLSFKRERIIVNICQYPVLKNRYNMLTLAIISAFSFPAIAASTSDIPASQSTLTVTGNAVSIAPEDITGPAGSYVARQSATGTKTSTPLRKNPQSVSVVTREQMDMLQSKTVSDAFGYSSGVMVNNRGASTTYDSLNIRGFSEIGSNSYLDGLKLQGDNYSDFQIDPWFLERAELLKGPSSVLYGKSSPGGVVALTSKRPDGSSLREIQFQAGSHSLFQTGFDFADSIDDEGVYSWRLTGLAKDQNQQQTGEESKRYALAPTFRWKPNDSTSLTLLGIFQNDPKTGYYGWLPKEGTVTNGVSGKLPTSFNEGEPGFNHISRNQKLLGYQFEHAFNDNFTVRQNLHYGTVDTDYRSIYGMGLSAADPRLINRGYIHDKEHLSTFAVDTQAQYSLRTGNLAHTLLTGIDYQRTRNDIISDYGSANPISVVAPQYGDTNVTLTSSGSQIDRQQQTGLYLQDQVALQRWLLTLGGRYDWATTETENRLSGNSISRQNSQQFTWRGGLNYLFDNGLTPYVSYSESFEPVAGSDVNGNTFDASRAKQYEAGVKYVPDNSLLSASAAVFQLTKNKNLTTDLANPLYSVQQGEIRSRGIELEGKAALTPNLNVIGSYSYTKAEFTQDNSYQGNTPYEISRNMASLWGDYTFSQSVLRDITLGAGLRYVGSSYGDNANSFKVGSYTVWDTVIKYSLDSLDLPGSSVGLNVNNLFNKKYVSSCFATYACYWGSERQITATATFRL